MKWTKNNPSIGDVRTVNKFAWYPTTMTDGKTVVWLWWYKLVEEYRQSMATYEVSWMVRNKDVTHVTPKPLTEGSMKTNVKNYSGGTAPMAAPPPAPFPPEPRQKTRQEIAEELDWGAYEHSFYN